MMAENKMYCKLPIPIQAYQTDKEFDIETLEGTMHASVGDYIITGINGEKYPCKPDIFEKTYIPFDSKNKMTQVASFFGKKIGEEFNIYSEYRGTLKCKITDNGLSFYYDAYGRWWGDSGLLIELLKGEAVIVDE